MVRTEDMSDRYITKKLNHTVTTRKFQRFNNIIHEDWNNLRSRDKEKNKKRNNFNKLSNGYKGVKQINKFNKGP